MSTEELLSNFLKSVLVGLRVGWPVWACLGLILLVRAAWWVRGEVRLHRSGINEIDEMLGLDFERYLEWLFDKMGYGVKRTSYQGDFGADLIITKDGIGTAVQAKKKRRGKIGVRAVQEAYASTGRYGCQQSMVVTNVFFTQAAIELARADKVEMWDRNRLRIAMRAVEGEDPPPRFVASPANPGAPSDVMRATCATCGSPVPERVRDYCLDHQKRFAGKVYCYQCQRRPRRPEE